MNTWESDREHLKKEMGAEITKLRIKKVAFIHDAKIVVNEVGVADPYAGGTVRVIYQDGKRGVLFDLRRWGGQTRFQKMQSLKSIVSDGYLQ